MIRHTAPPRPSTTVWSLGRYLMRCAERTKEVWIFTPHTSCDGLPRGRVRLPPIPLALQVRQHGIHRRRQASVAMPRVRHGVVQGAVFLSRMPVGIVRRESLRAVGVVLAIVHGAPPRNRSKLSPARRTPACGSGGSSPPCQTERSPPRGTMDRPTGTPRPRSEE